MPNIFYYHFKCHSLLPIVISCPCSLQLHQKSNYHSCSTTCIYQYIVRTFALLKDKSILEAHSISSMNSLMDIRDIGNPVCTYCSNLFLVRTICDMQVFDCNRDYDFQEFLILVHVLLPLLNLYLMLKHLTTLIITSPYFLKLFK